MTKTDDKHTYTFYLPGEERFFFNYFHLIAIALLLFFSSLGFFASKMTAMSALVQAILFTSPMYIVYYIYRKRFANEVTLDFDRQKIRFLFPDDRGALETDFQEVKQVHFQYYLIFVVEDARIMIKRPKDKKQVYEMLRSSFKVNRGYFAFP